MQPLRKKYKQKTELLELYIRPEEKRMEVPT